MNEEKINMALDIVNQSIAELMKEYSLYNGENVELQEKIRVLEEIKDKIYSGNVAFADKILQKNEEGNM